jgi:hypothetical protein
MLLSGEARQPLVPESDWKSESLAQRSGEPGHLLALTALRTIHVQRVSDDDLVHIVFRREFA